MSLYGQASGNSLKGKINRLTELKGYSAYEIAVINGYNGTEEEWLEDIYGLSKSWAVGGTGMREGEDTNNAKYWAEQARSAAGGGVVTFNGREGSVVPQSGDYTADMVGAIPAANKGKAGGVAELNDKGKVPEEQLQLPSTMPPSAHASSHKTGGSDALSPDDIGAAAKSDTVTATLEASEWTGDAAPYTYVLSVSGVTATSNQELLPAVDITAEQLEALHGANIQDGGQTAGNITLKAYGDVPTIDIPIRVIKRGD